MPIRDIWPHLTAIGNEAVTKQHFAHHCYSLVKLVILDIGECGPASVHVCKSVHRICAITNTANDENTKQGW